MTRWGKIRLCVCALAAFSFNQAQADISIDVFPAFAPNGLGSPNWPGYVSNALDGLQAGGADTGAGDRDSNPAKYETVKSAVDPSEMVYTMYNSWRGLGDPSAAFTGNPAVGGEFGNRIHFGVVITADDSDKFSLQELKWKLDSDDDDDYFDQNGDFSGANYSGTRMGIDWVDGIKGNGDDVTYGVGDSGTNLVNELVYVGVGDGFEAFNTAVSDQDDLDLTLQQINAACGGGQCSVNLTGSYEVGSASGSGNIVIFIPEPSSVVMLLGGMIGLMRLRRQGC